MLKLGLLTAVVLMAGTESENRIVRVLHNNTTLKVPASLFQTMRTKLKIVRQDDLNSHRLCHYPLYNQILLS